MTEAEIKQNAKHAAITYLVKKKQKEFQNICLKILITLGLIEVVLIYFVF